jgi:NADPH:quinone reductase-like Zn-dependent oxidoreductase
MKAIVQDRYGPPEEVLRLEEIDRPEIAGDEVLVRVAAASVHADIWHAVRGVPYVLRLLGAGLTRPKVRIPGMDMAGTVERVGPGVERLKVGDEVFGETLSASRWDNAGAFAEFVAAPEEVLLRKPAGMSFAEAAAVPTSGFVALQAVKAQAEVRAGQKVLINGAAGGVGAFAVQLAKAYGAEVTAVDSGEKLEMLRGIGADHVVDYRQQDYTRMGVRYDAIVDVAAKRSLRECARALTPNGVYVLTGDQGGRWVGAFGDMLRVWTVSLFVTQRVGGFVTLGKREALQELKDLIEQGKVRPVIDRTYPLEQVVAAIRQLEEGRVQGKVVLTV